MMMTFAYDSPKLIIDFAELQRVNSDSCLVKALSRQTGYWPVFTFLDSMNGLIDLASVGLIGQKGTVYSRMLNKPTNSY
jgi:RNA12 protein